MMHTDCVIIGAGHSGLAMSQCLTECSVDHVVLERGEVANSWKQERWDSLRLLTPNWQTRLPGLAYSGNDPDGYMNVAELSRFLEHYAQHISAPLHLNTTVTAVSTYADGYQVVTDRGSWHCDSLVIATGACNIANVPKIAEFAPSSIRMLTPQQYRNPDQLDQAGVLVVGASASGLQLAEEIHRSSRPVTLAIGEHVRLPRTYRGKDIQWWMDKLGIFDERFDEIDDLNRGRNLPSPQLIGTAQRSSLDLNRLLDQGVSLRGRLAGFAEGKAQFSGSLANTCELADLKMNRLLNRIDEYALEHNMEAYIAAAQRDAKTHVETDAPLLMDLQNSNIKTILWATGYRPDYAWLDLPVVDPKGRIRHRGGIVDHPGMYLLGTPLLRRRKSSFIHGAEDDARDLSQHLVSYLAARPGKRNTDVAA
ncbi:MAG: NAD(P)-binding domain-containing protein [Gammaproteobacteria bacterium]|nr:NAD(P)-binding domain-containing protein [Gammaproteobacteria bacterium]MCP4980735.1 NAD(P)-binding domain-containing protein [Gammaproteobacteria bacterium]